MIRAVGGLNCFRPVLILFILMLCSVCVNASENPLQVKAQESYKTGDYAGAIAIYNSILRMNVESPELYYNIGNAWFKLHKIPNAILFFERAHRLAPRNKEISYNLDLARSMAVDKLTTIPEFFIGSMVKRIRSLFSSNSWAILALVGILPSLALILLFLFSNKQLIRKLSLIFAFACMFAGLISLVFSIQQHALSESKSAAIIMTPAVTLKSAPDKNGTDLFVLHEGTKVEIDDRLGEWLEVRISDGNNGWLLASDLEVI